MKKINFLLLAFVMLVALRPLGAMAQDRGISGDANGDGKVNITDVTTIINYLLSGDGSAIDLSAADVDGNGTVKITDVTELINILLGNAEPTHPDTMTFTVNGVSVTMVYVAPGTFMMGSTEDNDSQEAKPAHQVTLTKGFYISQTEVTQEFYTAVVGYYNGAYISPQNPATYETVSSLQNFFGWLSYYVSQGQMTMRLPTEAEWEFAARGGNLSRGYRYAGSDDIDEVAWYRGNSGDTMHPVAQKSPNELGLYDMSGNAYEWVQDYPTGIFQEYYSAEPQVDPLIDANSPYAYIYNDQHIIRGGAFGYFPEKCTVTSRGVAARNAVTGFRIVYQPE